MIVHRFRGLEVEKKFHISRPCFQKLFLLRGQQDNGSENLASGVVKFYSNKKPVEIGVSGKRALA
jgi:hypothetical protein